MKKLFENWRRFVLDEAITGSGLHDLVARSSLHDIKQKSGMEALLNAAYISGQRNEPIDDLDDGDPWFQDEFALLQVEWQKGRQWADQKSKSYSLNESLDSLLQSDDLANVNQGIELAVMMGDIPDPDKIKMYPDKFNKLLIQYTSAEDADKFIAWLEQNGIYHEESPEIYAGKPFYGASRRPDYFWDTADEKMKQRMPGYSRIRIHIATGDEGFDVEPISRGTAIGIRGVGDTRKAN